MRSWAQRRSSLASVKSAAPDQGERVDGASASGSVSPLRHVAVARTVAADTFADQRPFPIPYLPLPGPGRSPTVRDCPR